MDLEATYYCENYYFPLYSIWKAFMYYVVTFSSRRRVQVEVLDKIITVYLTRDIYVRKLKVRRKIVTNHMYYISNILYVFPDTSTLILTEILGCSVFSYCIVKDILRSPHLLYLVLSLSIVHVNCMVDIL